MPLKYSFRAMNLYKLNFPKGVNEINIFNDILVYLDAPTS